MAEASRNIKGTDREDIFTRGLLEVLSLEDMEFIAHKLDGRQGPIFSQLYTHPDQVVTPKEFEVDEKEYEMFEDLAESLKSSGDFRTVNGDKKIEILMALARELTLEEVEALARPYQHKTALAGIIL